MEQRLLQVVEVVQLQSFAALAVVHQLHQIDHDRSGPRTFFTINIYYSMR